MTKEEFIRRIENDLEITGTQLTESTSISSIDEWDSLAAMTVLAIIDENFNLNFSISELNEVSSIGDIIRLVGEDQFEE